MSITCPKCCEIISEIWRDEVMEQWFKKREDHHKVKEVEAALDGREPPLLYKPFLPKRYVCKRCNLLLEEKEVGMGGCGNYILMTKL